MRMTLKAKRGPDASGGLSLSRHKSPLPPSLSLFSFGLGIGRWAWREALNGRPFSFLNVTRGGSYFESCDGDVQCQASTAMRPSSSSFACLRNRHPILLYPSFPLHRMSRPCCSACLIELLCDSRSHTRWHSGTVVHRPHPGSLIFGHYEASSRIT